MIDSMIELLVRWYGFSSETARELISEMTDKRALASLTRPYGKRAVLQQSPPKNDLHG